MKALVWIVLAGCFLCAPLLAFADTELIWDRNTEPDLNYYSAYYCSTKGCTVTKASTKSANIPQTLPATIPVFTLPANTEGSIAVTATDLSGNESGLSVSVPFDKAPPLVPVNPRTR